MHWSAAGRTRLLMRWSMSACPLPEQSAAEDDGALMV